MIAEIAPVQGVPLGVFRQKNVVVYEEKALTPMRASETAILLPAEPSPTIPTFLRDKPSRLTGVLTAFPFKLD